MKKIPWKKFESVKSNFLARIIGVIGEDVTKYWLENVNCEYINCGRPTVYWEGNQKATLDFLLKKREPGTGGLYLVEQKNFFAYQNGGLRTIEDIPEFYENYEKWSKRKSNSTPAWRIFNELNNHSYTIKVKDMDEINKAGGTILIWGDVTESAKLNFMEKYKFYDVIGITSMVEDLIRWKDSAFEEFILSRESWTQELFHNFK